MKSNIDGLEHKNRDTEFIRNAKWAYTTRRIDKDRELRLVKGSPSPRRGDLVLAKVTKIGQHKRIELTNGRRARLFVGDHIAVTYGNRYAPDQYEALVPDTIGPCDLVAAGGVASKLTFKHGSMKLPTAIKPLGLVADENGVVINLADHALPAMVPGNRQIPVIAVVGSSMNAGKTTTAANLIKGLVASGRSVSAGKVTGTGAGGDVWFMQDAGAQKVLDFVDAGHPSTYLIKPAELKQTFTTLMAHLDQSETDIIVIEIADGLHQSETAQLVSSDLFARFVNGVIYAAGDALGAVYGADLLQQWGVHVMAISGVVTRSPLAMREIQDGIDLPTLDVKVLRGKTIADFIDYGLRINGTTLGQSGGAK